MFGPTPGYMPGMESLLTANRYLGVSPVAVQQLMYGAGATGQAPDVSGILGSMGLGGANTYFARGVATDELARLSSQQTGGDLSGTYAPMMGFMSTAMSASGASGGAMNPMQAAQSAVGLEQAGKALGGGAFFGAAIDMALYKLGVKPGVGMMRLKALLKVNPKEAMNQISQMTNKSPQEVQAAISGNVNALGGAFQKAMGITSPQDIAYVTTGDAANMITPEILREGKMGIGDVVSAAMTTTEGPAGRGAVQETRTPVERMDPEKGRMERDISQSVAKLGIDIGQIIARKFTELADDINKQTPKLMQEQRATTVRNATTPWGKMSEAEVLESIQAGRKH
jgi:hypothetical protein